MGTRNCKARYTTTQPLPFSGKRRTLRSPCFTNISVSRHHDELGPFASEDNTFPSLSLFKLPFLFLIHHPPDQLSAMVSPVNIHLLVLVVRASGAEFTVKRGDLQAARYVSPSTHLRYGSHQPFSPLLTTTLSTSTSDARHPARLELTDLSCETADTVETIISIISRPST